MLLKSPLLISPVFCGRIFSSSKWNNDNNTIFVFTHLTNISRGGKLWSSALFGWNGLQYVIQGSTVI